jgi:hypothetical protein
MTHHEEAIWKVAENLRRREEISVNSLLSACRAEGMPITVDDLASILTRFGRRHADHFVPRSVAEFIAKLIKPMAPRSILDPWAGMGFLPIPLNSTVSPT